MSEPTIAEACNHIEQLLSVLDNAYWEASAISHKDVIYSIIALLHDELAELAKLSVQDHGMPYEPVNAEFSEIKTKLSNLRKVMDDIVLRVPTSIQLDRLITQVTALLN